MSKSKRILDKNRLDTAGIFLVYCAVVGDVERTAAAFDLDPEVVRQLVKEEHWAQKLQRACPTLDPTKEPIIVNRALSFIQAHRLRMLLEKVIQAFDGLTPEQVLDRLKTNNKGGQITTISGRFMADLAAALEKSHHLCFAALADTPAERKLATESADEPLNAAALHSAVIRALSEATCPLPADALVKQLAEQIDNPKVVELDSNPKLLTNVTEVSDERKNPEPETPPATLGSA